MAGLQPRRQLHRDRCRDPSRRARPIRARAADTDALKRLVVPAEAAGERLDRYLAGLPEVGSRAAAERLLSAGAVRVDGERRGKSHKLAGGEELEIEAPAPVAEPSVPLPELTIAYEDEHLLVVDKPAGVVVHPAPGHAGGTLAQALAAAGAKGGEEDRPGIVHRLDRDTSGLLVVARSDETYEQLQRLIRQRELTREYLALVVGKPRSRRGTIDAPVGRDRHDRLRHSLDTDTPRDAVTHFELEELLSRHALLRVQLETGRTHQIRVHLAAIDLPISGDPTYGIAGDLDLERQFLHAARLAFEHPVTGAPVDVSSPLPPDLAAALAAARS
ncbi:MAG TPA: RluA family pseudouridine synthase [Gaiellaceae bacterium]|nr:RluA family pseudouridine synthase [Gaiellaceae bacterium]